MFVYNKKEQFILYQKMSSLWSSNWLGGEPYAL